MVNLKVYRACNSPDSLVINSAGKTIGSRVSLYHNVCHGHFCTGHASKKKCHSKIQFRNVMSLKFANKTNKRLSWYYIDMGRINC